MEKNGFVLTICSVLPPLLDKKIVETEKYV